MSELAKYLEQHAKLVARTPGAKGTDVYFFIVQASAGANAETLRSLIHGHPGEFGAVDIFDGKEHGYIEIGAWLGSQRHALALIGLGTELGLWRLLSPRTVMGADTPPDLEKTMAESGLISLMVRRAEVPQAAG